MTPVPATVVLAGYPVQLGVRSREHVAEWMREFQLIDLGGTQHAIPQELVDTVNHLTATYAQELSEPERRLEEAAARGDEFVDLTYPVRLESESVVVGWSALLQEVDDYCSAGDLLTLRRGPELVALQEWVTAEFMGQIRGRPPRPWSEFVAR